MHSLGTFLSPLHFSILASFYLYTRQGSFRTKGLNARTRSILTARYASSEIMLWSFASTGCFVHLIQHPSTSPHHSTRDGSSNLASDRIAANGSLRTPPGHLRKRAQYHSYGIKLPARMWGGADWLVSLVASKEDLVSVRS